MTTGKPCPRPHCGGWLFEDEDGVERCFACGRAVVKVEVPALMNAWGYDDFERTFTHDYGYAAEHQHKGFHRRKIHKHRSKRL
jgi:hypothetical protein